MQKVKKIMIILTLVFLQGSVFAQGAFSFTTPITTGTPNPGPIPDCGGAYGLRMDDGNPALKPDATAIWCTSHTVDLSQSFRTEFKIRFGTSAKADGITFTLQRDPNGLTAIGSGTTGGAGGYLGVTDAWGGPGISPSVNIEFDIFDNDSLQGDIKSSHTAVSYNGVLNTPVSGPTAISILDDNWHDVIVEWNACDTTLSVKIDGIEKVHLEDDLVDNVFGGTPGGVFFGFTSATYSDNTTHDICFINHEIIPCGPCDFDPEFIISGGLEPCSYLFTNTTTLPAGLYSLGTKWEFSDGTVLYGENVEYTSNSVPGTVFACMKMWVTDGQECCELEVCESSEIFEDCDPCMKITDVYIDYSGSEPFNFSVHGIDTDNPVLGYFWDFGDGNYATGANVSHTYATGGTYDVTLKVFYFDQASGTCCSHETTITVEAPFPPQQPGINTAEETHLKTLQLKITPNPSNGEFSLEMADETVIKTITVYNQAGQMVYENNRQSGNSRVRLALNKLSPGIYTIVINENSTQPVTGKLMLQ